MYLVRPYGNSMAMFYDDCQFGNAQLVLDYLEYLSWQEGLSGLVTDYLGQEYNVDFGGDTDQLVLAQG